MSPSHNSPWPQIKWWQESLNSVFSERKSYPSYCPKSYLLSVKPVLQINRWMDLIHWKKVLSRRASWDVGLIQNLLLCLWDVYVPVAILELFRMTYGFLLAFWRLMRPGLTWFPLDKSLSLVCSIILVNIYHVITFSYLKGIFCI